MNRLQSIREQLKQGVRQGDWTLRKLSQQDFVQVQELLKQYSQDIIEEYFELILKEMDGNNFSVFYVVAIDDLGKIKGLGSFFYEEKFTRGGCCAIHMSDIYTNQKLSEIQKIDLEKTIVQGLSNVAFGSKDCYKASLHVPFGHQTHYNQLNYEPLEKHMVRITSKQIQ